MSKKFRLATTTILMLVAATIFFYAPVVWGDPGKPNASDYIVHLGTAIPWPDTHVSDQAQRFRDWSMEVLH